MWTGDAQTVILIGCLSFFHAGIFHKHHKRLFSYYPFRPHTRSVLVVFGTLFLVMLVLPSLILLKLFGETTAITNMKEGMLIGFYCFPFFLGLFKCAPSLDPFNCPDCDAEYERNRPPLPPPFAAPALSPNANLEIIDNPLPPHKGDLTCTMCFSRDSVHATVFKCGHYVACSECFHQFMAYGHTRCPRCCAERVY